MAFVDPSKQGGEHGFPDPVIPTGKPKPKKKPKPKDKGPTMQATPREANYVKDKKKKK